MPYLASTCANAMSDTQARPKPPPSTAPSQIAMTTCGAPSTLRNMVPNARLMTATASSSPGAGALMRSEEHTSELQSLMRISYAVFCLKKNKKYDNLADILIYD